ncbi:MAG: hypothetical protein IKF65_09080 [Clostridia bacterium]|nr:hypothetical protein [Clostridia bacterium]
MIPVLGDMISPIGAAFSLLALLAILAVVGAVIAGTVLLIVFLVRKKKKGAEK